MRSELRLNTSEMSVKRLRFQLAIINERTLEHRNIFKKDEREFRKHASSLYFELKFNLNSI